MGRARYAALVAIGALGACGDAFQPEPDLDVGISVRWPDSPDSPAELGYTIHVGIGQRVQPAPSSRCRLPTPSAAITVNGQSVPLAQRANGCISISLQLGPFREVSPDEQSLHVQMEEDGETVAVADFDGLIPGATATLASPADGRVRAGDEIVVVPPAAIPSSVFGWPQFFPLEGAAFDPEGLIGPAGPQRLFDGIHAPVPEFVGPALVIFNLSSISDDPFAYHPTISCTGFALCDVWWQDVKIGPLFVEGVP